MRFFLICSRESDYLQDLTFAGLASVLGPSSVVDFPARWQYRRPRRFPLFPRQEYPRNLGYVPGVAENLPAGVGLGEAVRGLKAGEFDLAILGSAKPDALLTFQALFEHVSCPWIFLDGGDRRELGGDFERTGGKAVFQLFQSLVGRKRPAAVFKRELPLGAAMEDVHPLPFSVNSSLVPALSPDSPKRFQVLFRGVESSETRRKAFELLRGKYDCDANGSVPGQKFRKYDLRGSSYFRALNESKVALSFRGEGFDTLRYWEVPACGGLLLSEEPEIQIPEDFIQKKHALFCRNDLSDLLSMIDHYLAHEDEARAIAREGQKHALKFHTHIARAQYLLGVLETELKIKA